MFSILDWRCYLRVLLSRKSLVLVLHVFEGRNVLFGIFKVQYFRYTRHELHLFTSSVAWWFLTSKSWEDILWLSAIIFSFSLSFLSLSSLLLSHLVISSLYLSYLNLSSLDLSPLYLSSLYLLPLYLPPLYLSSLDLSSLYLSSVWFSSLRLSRVHISFLPCLLFDIGLSINSQYLTKLFLSFGVC